MNRFFVEPDRIVNKIVEFPEDLTHQIMHVLRLTDGDRVEVFDNHGHVYLVTLKIELKRNQVLGEIRQNLPMTSEPNVQISLYFSMSTREKVEWILQKGTEVGVCTFSPFISHRSLTRTPSISENRRQRWEKIIQEAAEQSGRERLPKLNLPKEFDACLLEAPQIHELNLIAWEGVTQQREVLLEELANFKGQTIGLFTGPEGGFSAEEVQLAKQAGLRVTSLGRRILRMETAAIVFPALVLFALQDF